MQQTNSIHFLKNLSFIILIVAVCYFVPIALGEELRFDRIYNPARSIGLLALLLVSLHFSKILFRVILIIHLTLAVLYYQIAREFGLASFGNIYAIYETNATETKDFLTTIPYMQYVILTIVAFVVYKLTMNLCKGFKLNKITLIIFIILLCFSTIFTVKHKRIQLLTEPKQPILEFILSWKTALDTFKNEKQKIEQALVKEANWTILDSKQNKNIYVLVIGESERRDYQSTYGYPIDTSPFSRNNAQIVDGLVSASYTTPLSLQRMLTRNIDEHSFYYEDTFITLAKKANIKTYWLSNQNINDTTDAVSFRIGKRADVSNFINRLSFEGAKFDTELSPLFKQVVKENTQTTQPIVIVLHIFGSHTSICDRISGKSQIIQVPAKKIACYLSSIKQTDDLLKDTVNILKESKKTYSLIYFSDHGQGHVNKDTQQAFFLHNSRKKQGYDIPFFKFSDNQKASYIKNKKSGLYMLNQLSAWLGIKTAELPDYDMFSGKDDDVIHVFNGVENINYADLEDDPPIIFH